MRKIGYQKAHYLTLTTKAISVQQAVLWGLVDAHLEKSEILLKQHLIRLQKLPVAGIGEYKRYMNEINGFLSINKDIAVQANIKMFSDAGNLNKIFQFIEKGKYPWEEENA